MRLYRPLLLCIVPAALCLCPVISQARQDIRLWLYKDYTNPNTGHRVHEATKVTRGFIDTPDGRVAGRITISSAVDRRAVEFDVLTPRLTQMMDCPPGCTVAVKLDDNDPVQVKARLMPVGSYGLLLLPPDDVIDMIKRSESFAIDVAIKGDKTYTFDFDTRELDWPRDDK